MTFPILTFVLLAIFGDVTAHPVLLVRVLRPNLEVAIRVNGEEIRESPALVDSLGLLAFTFEAECPCLVEIYSTAVEGPSMFCGESPR